MVFFAILTVLPILSGRGRFFALRTPENRPETYCLIEMAQPPLAAR